MEHNFETDSSLFEVESTYASDSPSLFETLVEAENTYASDSPSLFDTLDEDDLRRQGCSLCENTWEGIIQCPHKNVCQPRADLDSSSSTEMFLCSVCGKTWNGLAQCQHETVQP